LGDDGQSDRSSDPDTESEPDVEPRGSRK
jgi:hypothetical protein